MFRRGMPPNCHCEEPLGDAAIQCALATEVSGKWIATGAARLRDDEGALAVPDDDRWGRFVFDG